MDANAFALFTVVAVLLAGMVWCCAVVAGDADRAAERMYEEYLRRRIEKKGLEE